MENCDKPHFGKGYCIGHYTRVQKHGHPQADKPLRKFRHKGEGYHDSKGYWILADGRKSHRVVMEGILGRPLLRHENVHHKNTIRDDNRPENLELWVTSQPSGGRVEDMVTHAAALLALYAPHLLAEHTAT